jgi:hypothetical protein
MLLESGGREATLKNDIEANDRLLADGWLNINVDGSITTKAKLMELLKGGSFKIVGLSVRKFVQIRRAGDSCRNRRHPTPRQLLIEF